MTSVARELPERPSWWPAHVPDKCPNCRSLMRPGEVRAGWAHCDCPGATGKPPGHDMVFRCAARPPGECRTEFWPPEHLPGHVIPERPRVM